MFLLIPLTLLAILLAGTIALWPSSTRTAGGKARAFLGVFALPIAIMAGAAQDHMERSKTTEFCISCHVMQPYYDSLFIDEQRHLPAAHYQNRNIPREKACFTCHTKYTMFGDMKAKLAGLKHLWVYYFGDIPEKIELYEPYNDRECLHCHEGARAYEEHPQHIKERAKLESGKLNCFSCHSEAHGIHNDLDRLPRWDPNAEVTLPKAPTSTDDKAPAGESK